MLCWIFFLLFLLLHFPGLIVGPSEDQERLEDALHYLQKQIQDLDLSIKKSGNRIEIAQEDAAVSPIGTSRREKTVRVPRNRRQGSSPSGRQYTNVYYNAYDAGPFGKYLNAGMGKIAPFVHGTVMFKGPQWPREGTEVDFVFDENWKAHIRENEPRMHSEKLRASKFMGRIRKSPEEIDDILEGMRRTRFGVDDYHFTKRNCNHFCKELLKHTTGRKLPNRYNRLSRIPGKMGLNRIPRWSQYDSKNRKYGRK